MWLSAGLAVTCVWAGVTITYAAPRIPASFAIIAVATALYAAALLTHRLRAGPRPAASRRKHGGGHVHPGRATGGRPAGTDRGLTARRRR